MDWLLEFVILAAWVIRLRIPAQQIGSAEIATPDAAEEPAPISELAGERR
jgi:hypothetical protein